MRAVVLHGSSPKVGLVFSAPRRSRLVAPVALFQDLFQPRQKRGRIGAVEGAVIEALADHADEARATKSPSGVETTAGFSRIASAERMATCGALMIGAVKAVPKAPLLLME